MELIQGEGGYNIGNTDFFNALISILKNEKIPVLVDEIQTFGRTSELYAAQHFNIINHARYYYHWKVIPSMRNDI